jgi:hypothetical protein
MELIKNNNDDDGDNDNGDDNNNDGEDDNDDDENHDEITKDTDIIEQLRNEINESTRLFVIKIII